MPIFKSRQKLDLSYVPEKILCRDREIQQTNLLLEGSGKALISGDIGTGKTLLARYVARNAAYINCFINKSEHAVLETALSKLRPNFNPAGMPSRKLWDQIPDGSFIILDEVEGILLDDLVHFLYTLSRRSEYGRKIKYIAITRDAEILRQMINDDATWSTFAEKSVIHLKPYSRKEMVEILEYRASEALREGTFDREILSLIADVALESRGHMRTAIEVLRTSALIAEKNGQTRIEPENVREANLDTWVSDLNLLDRDHLLALLSVAAACSGKAYVTMDEIKEQYAIKCENYNMKPVDIDILMTRLENEGFIHRTNGTRYTILTPTNVLKREIERFLDQ